MAIRRPTSRTSTNHIFVSHNEQKFMLELGYFQTKSILYRVKKKILSGKLIVPNLGEKKGMGYILITCSTGENGLKFSWI